MGNLYRTWVTTTLVMILTDCEDKGQGNLSQKDRPNGKQVRKDVVYPL